jgi:hypothetical protein
MDFNIQSALFHVTDAKAKSTNLTSRHLGGVVVSLLVTGPKGRAFEPSQGGGFLWEIKIRSTPSCRIGSKAGRSHVLRFNGM